MRTRAMVRIKSSTVLKEIVLFMPLIIAQKLPKSQYMSYTVETQRW